MLYIREKKALKQIKQKYIYTTSISNGILLQIKLSHNNVKIMHRYQ